MYSQFVRNSSGTHPALCLVGLGLFTLRGHHSLPTGIGVKKVKSCLSSTAYSVIGCPKKKLALYLVAELSRMF